MVTRRSVRDRLTGIRFGYTCVAKVFLRILQLEDGRQHEHARNDLRFN